MDRPDSTERWFEQQPEACRNPPRDDAPLSHEQHALVCPDALDGPCRCPPFC